MISCVFAVTFALLQQAPPAPSRSLSVTTAIIRGHIVRTDGRALPRAAVELERLDADDRPRRVATDENGGYEFAALPAGRYRVTAWKIGYLTLEYGERRASDGGTAVVLSAAEVRERIDIALPRASAIAGRIVDENGEAVENAIVRLLQTRRFRGRRQLTEVPGVVSRRTDDVGRYRVFGVKPGSYIVSATIGQLTPGVGNADVPGYAPTYFPGTPNPAEAQFVTVRLSEDVLSVDFALARVATARVAGKAIDSDGNPITGGLALIPSHRASVIGGQSLGAHISPDGDFEFRNVPPGDYVVQASRARRNTSSEGEFAAQFVTVNGRDITGINLRATIGSTISGRIASDDDGSFSPLDVELVALPVDYDLAPAGSASPTRAAVESDGSFQMTGVHGPRRLRVTHTPRGWTLKAILLNGNDVTDRTLSFGAKDQSIKDLQVMLTNRQTKLTGAVAEARAKTQVLVFSTRRDAWDAVSRFTARTTVDDNGGFAVEGLPPGEYYAAAVEAARVGGPEDEWQDPDLFESLVPSAKVITLFEGQETTIRLRR
jgi:protocatechuate 3,4-dioxygenase beta subunit